MKYCKKCKQKVRIRKHDGICPLCGKPIDEKKVTKKDYTMGGVVEGKGLALLGEKDNDFVIPVVATTEEDSPINIPDFDEKETNLTEQHIKEVIGMKEDEN